MSFSLVSHPLFLAVKTYNNRAQSVSVNFEQNSHFILSAFLNVFGFVFGKISDISSVGVFRKTHLENCEVN